MRRSHPPASSMPANAAHSWSASACLRNRRSMAQYVVLTIADTRPCKTALHGRKRRLNRHQHGITAVVRRWPHGRAGEARSGRQHGVVAGLRRVSVDRRRLGVRAAAWRPTVRGGQVAVSRRGQQAAQAGGVCAGGVKVRGMRRNVVAFGRPLAFCALPGGLGGAAAWAPSSLKPAIPLTAHFQTKDTICGWRPLSGSPDCRRSGKNWVESGKAGFGCEIGIADIGPMT